MAKSRKKGAGTNRTSWKTVAKDRQGVINSLEAILDDQRVENSRLKALLDTQMEDNDHLREELKTVKGHHKLVLEEWETTAKQLKELQIKELEHLARIVYLEGSLTLTKNQLARTKARAVKTISLYRNAGGILAMPLLSNETFLFAIAKVRALCKEMGYDADELQPMFREMIKKGQQGLHKMCFIPGDQHLQAFINKPRRR